MSILLTALVQVCPAGRPAGRLAPPLERTRSLSLTEMRIVIRIMTINIYVRVYTVHTYTHITLSACFSDSLAHAIACDAIYMQLQLRDAYETCVEYPGVCLNAYAFGLILFLFLFSKTLLLVLFPIKNIARVKISLLSLFKLKLLLFSIWCS